MLQNSQLSTYSKFRLKCPTFIINYFPEFTMRNICFPESIIKKKKKNQQNQINIKQNKKKKTVKTIRTQYVKIVLKSQQVPEAATESGRHHCSETLKNEIRQEMRQCGFSLLEAMIVYFKSKIKCALRQASPECLFQQISNSEYVMCVVSLNYLSFVNFHRQTMQTTSM